MKQSIMVICCFFMAACLAGDLWANEDAGCRLVQKTDTSVVNWKESVLNAVGKGTPPEAYRGNPEGRGLALAQAVENARQEMLTAVKQIPIDASSTVGSLAESDDAVFAGLKEMIDKAELIHQEYMTDGSVTVTIQMSMYGAFYQLVLPERIKQIESVKPISTVSDEGLEDAGGDASDTGQIVSAPYTGMIVDVRGINITPCLAPRVCDESGREVFGAAYASREYAVLHGMTGYLSDLDAATHHPRVADRPLILKGIRNGEAGETDIVVSNTDAARLRSAFENLAFLRQCRVLIVVDAVESSNGE